jgi:hypothetical protein
MVSIKFLSDYGKYTKGEVVKVHELYAAMMVEKKFAELVEMPEEYKEPEKVEVPEKVKAPAKKKGK